ncbi:MAG TPA: preprotein translocase subunit YajC [Mycobacteriales bacterium]|nr:preprotein translocase subunit YajC [Mycobacteriales bacterium]
MVLIFPLLLIALWYFTIRPQQQRVRNQRALLAALQVGDEVVTIGGLIGTITSIDDLEVGLDIGNGIIVRLARQAVQTRFTSTDPGAGTEAGDAG